MNKFVWNGKQVSDEAKKKASKVLILFGLAAEGKAKQQLRKGHGVETGTLRRSIHIAMPGYDFAGDDIEPCGGTPERGGRDVEPENGHDRISLLLGSGLNYAMWVHEGHGSFEGYHYLLNGIEEAKHMLPILIDMVNEG